MILFPLGIITRVNEPQGKESGTMKDVNVSIIGRIGGTKFYTSRKVASAKLHRFLELLTLFDFEYFVNEQ
jgi:hypothetical protein